MTIANITATTTGKKAEDIIKLMHDRTTFNPDEAKEYGLVTRIKSDLIPKSAEFYSIDEFGSCCPATATSTTNTDVYSADVYSTANTTKSNQNLYELF
jgi:hypothetical protein